MIDKLECTCIEAYKSRKMRDPNCCACSCCHNDLVEQLAKANETIASLNAVLKVEFDKREALDDELAKANERVKELESENKGLSIRISTQRETIRGYQEKFEQLRKEQDNV